MKKTENHCCITCKHWKNEQAELEYSSFNGVCTSHRWKFNTVDGRFAMVLDRENVNKGKHMGVHGFENQNNKVPVGEAEKSRYLLVTNEYFGCIFHEKRK